MANNKECMMAQIEEIQKHKWIESEKAGHDLGEEAVKDWVKKHAKEWRDNWNKEHEEHKMDTDS